MLVRSLLLLGLPVSSLLIQTNCPPQEKCSDRQFCDQRGKVTAFRSNKLSFSTDLRGLQVRELDWTEVCQVVISDLPELLDCWGPEAGGVLQAG